MDNFDLFEHIDFLDEQACEISMAERSFAQPQATIYRGDKWDQLRETLQNNDDLMAAISDTTGQPLSSMITEAVLAIRATLLDGFTISLALSGGKDSTGTLHLLLFAMIGLVREGRGNEISAYHWISHTDTQVENPEVRNLHIPVENEHLFRFKMNADSGLRVHHFRTPQSTNSDVR
ncbi:hypothetical protein [Aeromonas hydrophila]